MTLIVLEFDVEVCCEVCGEVVHNHFDCPSCKIEYASTDCYESVSELEDGEILSCEECGAQFKKVGAEWEPLPKKGNTDG